MPKKSDVPDESVVQARTMWAKEPELTVKMLAERLQLNPAFVSRVVRWEIRRDAGGPMNRRAVRRRVH